LNNKYYNIGQSNFGKQSEYRFDDFEVYDYNMMLSEIQKILNNSIDINSKILKRRSVEVKQLPKEFAITELRKKIQNNIESFSTFAERKQNVYNPDKVNVLFNDVIKQTPILPPPVVEVMRIEPTLPTGGGSVIGGGSVTGGGAQRNTTMPGQFNNNQIDRPSYQDYKK
jgi:hypothetical protein